MKAKTQTRILAEQIQSLTGESLLTINYHAWEMIEMALFTDFFEALEYLLEMAKEDNK